MKTFSRKFILTLTPPIGVLSTLSPLLLTSCGIAYLELTDEQKALFGNTLQTALPQTAMYSPMSKWMSNSKHKLLFIGYDGTRVDAVAKLNTNTSAFYSNSFNNKPLFAYCGGAKRGDQESKSNPGWASVFTGEWGKINGVTTNDGKGSNLKTKLLQTTLSENDYSVFFSDCNFSWVWKEQVAASKINYQENTDEVNFKSTDGLIKNNGARALFTIFNDVDHAGHNDGFNPNNSKYMKALQSTDNKAKQLINQVQERLDAKNWMIVMTTDHGGKGESHGGKSDAEIYTWISCNQDLLNGF